MIPDSFYSVDDVEYALLNRTDLDESEIEVVLQALEEIHWYSLCEIKVNGESEFLAVVTKRKGKVSE